MWHRLGYSEISVFLFAVAQRMMIFITPKLRLLIYGTNIVHRV